MLRSIDRWAVAVRRRDGTLATEVHQITQALPHGLLRGPMTIASSLRIGVQALRIAVRETVGVEPTSEQLGVTFGAGGVAVLAIFIVAPGVLIGSRGIGGAALEASIRAAMLVAYLFVISRNEQTRAILRYHGAEHKVVAAFERVGSMPTKDDARSESPVHMRCGTTFIALFVVSCGVVFTVVPRAPLWLGAVLRLAATPFVIALAYELMRGAAKEPKAIWARAVSWPGRTLQRVTTREPNEDELDVALAALETLVR